MSTAGGVEEDFIKCLAPTYLGDFSLPGKELRKKGINRIGNLLVPNDNYCKFEDWIMPLFDKMLQEQNEKVFVFVDCWHSYCLYIYTYYIYDFEQVAKPNFKT